LELLSPYGINLPFSNLGPTFTDYRLDILLIVIKHRIIIVSPSKVVLNVPNTIIVSPSKVVLNVPNTNLVQRTSKPHVWRMINSLLGEIIYDLLAYKI